MNDLSSKNLKKNLDSLNLPQEIVEMFPEKSEIFEEMRAIE